MKFAQQKKKKKICYSPNTLKSNHRTRVIKTLYEPYDVPSAKTEDSLMKNMYNVEKINISDKAIS